MGGGIARISQRPARDAAGLRGKEWKDHGGIDPDPGKQDRPATIGSAFSSSKGNGVMDTKQVFYEGLELVTGFVFYKDGVIVTQAPDILWIRDHARDWPRGQGGSPLPAWVSAIPMR